MDLDTATESWDLLTRHLDRFITAWQDGGGEPALNDYLPDPSQGSFRRVVLVELIKIDIEHRLEAGKIRPLEGYVADHPELAEQGEPPCDIIYEEFHIRRSVGEPVSAREYLSRFPAHAKQLETLFSMESSRTISTSLNRDRIEDVEAGHRLGDFDLLIALGKGAFASVFLARQISMQRLVAVKVSADRGNEPQTLAQLDHPHIIRVFDQHRIPERKMRLLYMQFAPGGTLQDVVKLVKSVPPGERTGRILFRAVDDNLERNGQPVSVPPSRRKLESAGWAETICRLGVQLASALDYAHAHGVLHRDIKPANVLLDAHGSPKLADFNISFASGVSGQTPAAYFGGSLAYMSPEQLEACSPKHSERTPDQLDGLSDLYSLSVLLWELLDGERPFKEDALGEKWQHTLDAMLVLRQAGPPAAGRETGEVADGLRRVLVRGLSPEPEQRHPSGLDFARDLMLCLQPRTRRLLKGVGQGWRRIVERCPVLAVVLAAFMPNAFASVFNFVYNKHAIIDRYADLGDRFWELATAVNLIAFPVGICVLAVLVWPIRRTLQARDTAEETVIAQRSRATRFGRYAAAIGITEWIVAGAAYPVVLRMLGGELHANDYIHFFVSLSLCGLTAAAWPFFLVTWLSVRVFVPALLRDVRGGEQDEESLEQLSRKAGLYLLVAGCLPLVGAAFLALPESQNRTALGVTSVLGLIGFFVAWRMYGGIQRDIRSLLTTVRPVDSFARKPIRWTRLCRCGIAERPDGT